METPKVSIILPVYNAGPYLTKCLDSLVNQTLKDIEIICVLDCPTDGSDKIVYEYAALDNRIKVIANEKNLHIGLSRNVGLKNASGKYIGFIDHDDYCELNMYELLYNAAESILAPMALCNRDCIYTTDNEIQFDKKYFEQEKNSCNALLTQVCTGQLSSNAFVIWNKIYRKDFIIDNKITFLDTQKYSAEDAIFNVEFYSILIKNNIKTAYVQNILYHHVFHIHNTGRSVLYQANQINFREKLSEIIKIGSLYEEYCDYLFIGNIRYSYTMFRHHYFKLSQLKSFPNICSNIKWCWSLWHRDLTLPKNMFAIILRLLLLKN